MTVINESQLEKPLNGIGGAVKKKRKDIEKPLGFVAARPNLAIQNDCSMFWGTMNSVA